jgi:hypothetical protein
MYNGRVEPQQAADVEVAELERSLIIERIKAGFKKKGAKKPGPKIGADGPSRTTLWRRSTKDL